MKKLLLATLLILVSCKSIIPFLLVEENYDLKEKKGILLEYSYVTPGMYKKPFIIEFGKYIQTISNGKVDLESVNSYTVGNYDSVKAKAKIGDCKGGQKYSNFLDPDCKLVNSWYGVYFIFDDPQGKAKNFMLSDPSANPGDLNNLKEDSIKMIPELDQKLITWSTHEKQEKYYWEDFDKDFYFKQLGEIKKSEVKDKKDRKWLKMTGNFETISAFTDVKQTKMSSFNSIKAMVGVPTTELYDKVVPWYAFQIVGTTYTRYVNCGTNSFWAIVYYNGSELQSNNGLKVNYSNTTDIENEFKKMFDSMKLECTL